MFRLLLHHVHLLTTAAAYKCACCGCVCRPWNGVYLSEEYLGSVEAAEGITRELLDVYASAGVLPLLESAVKTDDELRHARELLGVAVY